MPKPPDRDRAVWRSITASTGARGFAALLDFASLAVTAYLLGPAGRGVVATILGWSRLLASFFGFSFQQVAVQRLTERGRERLQPLLGALIPLSGVACVLAWMAAVVYFALVRKTELASQPPALLALGLLLIPLLQWDAYGSHLLTALGRLPAYNAGLVVGRTLGFLVTVVGILLLGMGVHAPVAGTVLALAVGALAVTRALRREISGRLVVDRSEAGALLGGGARLHLNTIGAFLLTQMDIVMLSEMRPLEEVGWYQAAVQLSAAPLVFSSVAALVFYSSIAEVGPDEAWPVQRRVLLRSLAGLILVAVGAWAISPLVIPLILGAAFTSSVPVFRILLIPMLGISFAQLMTPQWIARGLFTQTSALTLTVGLVNFALNLLLIPRYGMYAAAWTTVGAFAISMVANTIFATWIELRWRRMSANQGLHTRLPDGGSAPAALARRSICLFGAFPDSQEYSRNRALRTALVEIGFEVEECRPRVTRLFDRAAGFHGPGSMLRAAWTTGLDWLSLSRHVGALRRHRLILVPYPSHLDVLLARLLTVGRRRTLVMDAFLLLHDTVVDDRGLVPKGGPASRFLARWERLALRSADLVLIDTAAQKRALCESYDLPDDGVVAIPVGIDETIWSPGVYPQAHDVFRVAFWGTFIPLHGVETFVRAADRLQSLNPAVRLELLGDGQTAPQIERLIGELRPENLAWHRGFESIAKVRALVESAHCVLGIFGTSAKADRVVPYKAYQALATGRPLVTRRSTALSEELSGCGGVVEVPPGHPAELAAAIDSLARDPLRCRKLAGEARRCYEERLSQAVIETVLEKSLARAGVVR